MRRILLDSLLRRPLTEAAPAADDAALAELAERQRSDLPTSSRILKALVKHGYVKDARSFESRRRARFVLTPKGKRLVPKLAALA